MYTSQRNRSVRRERTRPLHLLLILLLVVLLPAGVLAAPAPADGVTVTLTDGDGTELLTGVVDPADLDFDLSPYVTMGDDPQQDTTALHALIRMLEEQGEDPADPAVLQLENSEYGIYIASLLGSEDPVYWTYQVDGEDAMTGVYDTAVSAGKTLTFLRTEYVPEPDPDADGVTVTLTDGDGTELLSGTVASADLDFDLSPYVTMGDDPQQDSTALHALIRMLEDQGEDPADPAVLKLENSEYGIYIASLLGSEDPVYWTYQVDGEDAMTGVYDTEVSAGTELTFVRTEYVPEPADEEPVLSALDPSGLPEQAVRVDETLEALSEALAGTSQDWEMLAQIRYGRRDRVDEDTWLTQAQVRLTDPEQTVTDLERLVLVWTGLGYDARTTELDGAKTDLVTRMLEGAGQDTYTRIFGLIALDSAGYAGDAEREALIGPLLDARLADGGWSWSQDEPASDVDTTAMAVTALAPYTEDPEVQAAVDTALELLSDLQAADGTMGSSNGTAVTLMALQALGIDGDTDPRFVKEEGSLLSGLFRYQSEDLRFGFQNTEADGYATEQAFRALIGQQLLAEQNSKVPVAYAAASPEDLDDGPALPYDPDASGFPWLWVGIGAVAVVGVAVGMRLGRRRRAA